jgi:Ni/Co efflux regulator RcnB
MRTALLAAMAATLALPMTPAAAQHHGHHDDRGRHGHDDHGRHGHGRDRDHHGDYRHDDRGRHWGHRPPRAAWRHYDYNHYAPGYRRYYPDHYYVSRGYRPIHVTRATRVYRGYDGRYYCRRSDGTTGLIVGAALGGLLGNSLSDGRSVVLSTVLGGAAGGLLGREIDRGRIECR